MCTSSLPFARLGEEAQFCKSSFRSGSGALTGSVSCSCSGTGSVGVVWEDSERPRAPYQELFVASDLAMMVVATKAVVHRIAILTVAAFSSLAAANSIVLAVIGAGSANSNGSTSDSSGNRYDQW